MPEPIPYVEGEEPPSPRHIKVQMVDDSGESLGLFWMNVDEIQARHALRHDDLGEAIGVVRWIWRQLEEHLPYRSFEEWERGFLMDANPEREIVIWWGFAYAYCQYRHDNPAADSQAVYRTLVQIMLGQSSLAESPAMASELEDLMRSNPTELDHFTPEGEYTGELVHLR